MIARIASALWVRLLSVLALAGLVAAAGCGACHAAVVLDGKFGTSGALTGPNYSITASMGAIRGNNLFHSFSQFDLNAGDVAAFSGPANIQNILSRVTGGSPSSINGTIRSDIAGANFFFINPSGVMFGPNAAVDVRGSFAVSTANYVKLADGARFVAALDADDSMLSSAPVAAFGFLDGANGVIQVQGSLKAAPGTSLSVVGSGVSVVDGTRLEALNGRINLAGVTAPGEWTLPASSPSAGNGTPTASSESIVIRAGRLVVDNATISGTEGGIDIALTEGLEVLNGGQITTSAAGASKGGNIAIDSPSVLVDGQDNSTTPTRVAAETSSGNPQATGGDIVVHATSVQVLRGAEVSVSSFGAANAGQVDITTSTLLVDAGPNQTPTQIAANAAGLTGTASGAGGAIIVHADSVAIENGAAVIASSLGDGNAGTINVSAGSLTVTAGTLTTLTSGAGLGGEIRLNCDNITLDGPFSSISATTFGLNSQLPAGNAGTINITAGSLRLQNDAGISASTYGDGRGGDINIKANSLVLNTATSQGIFPGISASSNPDFFGGPGGGKGGNINLVAGSLTLQNGMLVSATTATPGDGGSITIDAGSVTLNNKSSIQSASVAGGQAGTISLTSSQNILLTENSSISTSAPQSSGGDIHVQAGGDIQLFDSKITAQAGLNGGNITLSAPSLTYLLRSTVTGEADTTGTGFGNGGNLTIDPSFLILNNSGLISKSSLGNGGNINIFSDFFFQSASTIDASAPFGLPGTVTVSAPQVDLSGSLIGLPSNLLGLETQLRPDCGVRLSGNISSFIVLGRGGLPLAPGGFLPVLCRKIRMRVISQLCGGILVLALLELALGQPIIAQVLPPPPAKPAMPTRLLVHEFRFEGNKVFSQAELAKVTAPFTNRAITSEELEDARRAVTLYYIKHGYVNSGAVIPDQDPTQGVVRLRISEGVLTGVDVHGNKWLSDNYIKGHVRRWSGPPLNVNELQDGLQLLRQNPNVEQINAELKPAAAPGTSLLDLRVVDEQPFRLGIQFDNERPTSVGSEEVWVVASDLNLTGHSDPFDLKYGIATGGTGGWDFSGADNMEGSYRLPLTRFDTTLGFHGSRLNTSITEQTFTPLDIKSLTASYGAFVRQPVYQTANQEAAVALGFDYRKNNSDLLGEPFNISPGAVEGRMVVSVLRFSQEWIDRGQNHVLALRSTFNFGLDVLDATDNGIPGDPDGKFFSWLGQAQYVRRLFNTQNQLVFRVSGQWTAEPMLALEQFSVGGLESVRGYLENQLVRDKGIASSVEFRVPVLFNKAGAGIVSLAPFFDFGGAWNINGSPSPTTIYSTGVGLLVTPGKHLSAQIYWGYRLHHVEMPPETDAQTLGLDFRLNIMAF